MCIICNLADPMQGSDGADKVLHTFSAARLAMKNAATEMLAFSKSPYLADDKRRQYDAAYKQMRRVMREWNDIERLRENPNNIQHPNHSETAQERPASPASGARSKDAS